MLLLFFLNKYSETMFVLLEPSVSDIIPSP